MAAEPIVVESQYSASPAKLWAAITERDRMVQWFFEGIPEFEPRAGFETEFDVEAEGEVYPHRWKILEAEPEKKVVYDWRYEGIEGVGRVDWEVFADGEGSRLKLTCTGYDTFPQDREVFTKESCVAGWEYFLHEQLKGYLDSCE